MGWAIRDKGTVARISSGEYESYTLPAIAITPTARVRTEVFLPRRNSPNRKLQQVSSHVCSEDDPCDLLDRISEFGGRSSELNFVGDPSEPRSGRGGSIGKRLWLHDAPAAQYWIAPPQLHSVCLLSWWTPSYLRILLRICEGVAAFTRKAARRITRDIDRWISGRTEATHATSSTTHRLKLLYIVEDLMR